MTNKERIERREENRQRLANALCYDTGLTVSPTMLASGEWGAMIDATAAAELDTIPDSIRQTKPLLVTIRTQAGREWTMALAELVERCPEGFKFSERSLRDLPLNVPITRREARKLRRRGVQSATKS